MKRYVFDVSIPDDGSLHVTVTDRGVFEAKKRFTPSQLLPLRLWLADPGTDWSRNVHAPERQDGISYDHETGKLRLDCGGIETTYDPNDDEAMARLVRKLKARTPLPRAGSDQPTIPDLPIPTDAEMARRTIYTQVGNAEGSGHKSRPRPRYNQQALPAEASRDLISSILGNLAAKKA